MDITKSVDFKIITDRCSQTQLELIVHQRLKFCSVDYQDNEEVLKTIVRQGVGRIDLVMEFLRICILILPWLCNKILLLPMIEK